MRVSTGRGQAETQPTTRLRCPLTSSSHCRASTPEHTQLPLHSTPLHSRSCCSHPRWRAHTLQTAATCDTSAPPALIRPSLPPSLPPTPAPRLLHRPPQALPHTRRAGRSHTSAVTSRLLLLHLSSPCLRPRRSSRLHSSAAAPTPLSSITARSAYRPLSRRRHRLACSVLVSARERQGLRSLLSALSLPSASPSPPPCTTRSPPPFLST